MSDYIYMLESHLSPDQNRVVADVQTAAGQAGVNLFLTGGAMRDMLGGFRIRDLDFVVEGNALKLAKAVCDRVAPQLIARRAPQERGVAVSHRRDRADRHVAPGKYPRGGAKPQVSPATIQEDLRGRDFTCNAIALSLNRASRGLLLDPMNGLADIGRRELRAISPYGFYDDPTRLLRLVRFRVRLGFAVEERTRMQVANAREAEVEKLIPPRAMAEELKRIGAEDSPAEILEALERSRAAGRVLTRAGRTQTESAGPGQIRETCRMLPDDANTRPPVSARSCRSLTEKMTPKEKQALIKSLEMPKADVDQWLKLETRSKKLETALRSARIRKASQVYHLVSRRRSR